jgi:DNA-binding transcriptional LysR family regulator
VQSGISASIAALERELGTDLFYRSQQQVQLTAAGRALLVEARRSLAAVNAGVAAARAAGGSMSGAVNIGVAGAVPAMLHLSRIFKEFQRLNPDVTIRLHELLSRPFDELRDGVWDILIAPGHGPPGITSMLLSDWPIMLACAETHPFAERTSVSLRAIVGEPFIDLPVGTTTRTLVDRGFEDAALERHTVAEVGGVIIVMALLREGLGVSLIPPVGGQYARGVRFVPVDPGIGSWEVTASHLDDGPRNPAAREFMAMLMRGPVDRRRRG